MVCSRCGQAVTEGAAACPACGQVTAFANAGSAALPPQTPIGTEVPVAAQKTSGMAIASLIFGILFLFPLNILAIVFGHISLSQIKKSAGRLGGRGIAIAGLVLGYLGLAMIPFILIVAAIAIPNLLRARMAANESAAVYSLRIIDTAEVAYQVAYPEVGYAPDLQSLGGASPCTSSKATACQIDNSLAVANAMPGKAGYIFTVTRSDDGAHFLVTAAPLHPNQTGVRTFCSTDDGVIRVDGSGAAIPGYEACKALPQIE